MGKEVESHPGWLRPGVVLRDTYLVGRPLGHGGFGITYLGVDLKLDIRVAIKEYLPRDLATRNPNGQTIEAFPDAREVFQHGRKRFMDEARVLARFGEHPNIVSVLGFFEANESAYLVMRYLEGQDVAGFLKSKGGRLPAQSAVEIILPVLEGLQAVHGAGLLHRDIKPQNIYLARDGEVKLLDFGAARYALLENSKTLTTILTPGYAAPEMYDPKDKVGPYTDVYSVGATLHEMLTGESPKDIFSRVGEDSLLPPAAIDASIDNELSAIVYKALSMSPEERFQDAHSFLNALSGVPCRKSGRRRISSTKTQWVISDSQKCENRENVGHHPAFHPTQPSPAGYENTAVQASMAYGHTQPAPSTNNAGPPGPSGVSPALAGTVAQPVSPPQPSDLSKHHSTSYPMTGPGPVQPGKEPSMTGPANDPRSTDHSQPMRSASASESQSGTPAAAPVSSPNPHSGLPETVSSPQRSTHPLVWFLAAFVIIGLTAVGSVLLFKWLALDDQQDHKPTAKEETASEEQVATKEVERDQAEKEQIEKKQVEKTTAKTDPPKKNTMIIDGIEIQKTIADVPECLRYAHLFLCLTQKNMESSGVQDFSAYRPLYVRNIVDALSHIASPHMERSVVESTCRKLISHTWNLDDFASIKDACKKHVQKSDLE